MCAGIAVAAVGTGYTLFGGASYEMPGNNSNRAVKLVSNSTTSFSGIDFAVPSGLTFGDVQKLAADYKFTPGGCTGGAPRFQMNVVDPLTNETKNIFAYSGSYPNYNDCPAGVWTSTGDLAESGLYVDATQVGESFYEPFSSAQSRFGSYAVTGIQLVTDSGRAVAQSLLVGNVTINGTTYTFDFGKDDCKDGGWKNYTIAPGPFKNQGQCVSYFARQQ